MIFRIIKFSSKWAVRVAGLFIILLLLTSALAWYVLPRMFTSEHISAVVTNYIQEIFHRPVVAGEVRFDLFEGITINDLRILDTVSGKGKDIISSGEINIHYQFLPLLLNKQLIIDTVAIKGLRVNVIKNESGVWNSTGLIKSDSLNPHNTSGLMLMLAIKEWQLSSGFVKILDLTTSAEYNFHDVNMRAWGFGFNKEFPFRLSFSCDKLRHRKVDWAFDGEGFANLANMDWTLARISKTSFQWSLGQKPVYLDLKLANFVSPVMSFAVEAPELTRGDLAFLGKLPPGLSVPASRWEVAAEFVGRNFMVQSLKAKAGNVELEGEGQIDFSTSPSVGMLSVETKMFEMTEIPRFYADAKQYALYGKAKVKAVMVKKGGVLLEKLFLHVADGKGVFRSFACNGANLTVSFKDSPRKMRMMLYGGGLKFFQQDFKGLEGEAVFENGDLNVVALKGRYNGSPFKLKMDIRDIKNNDRRISAMFYFKSLALPQFFNTVKDFSKAIRKNGSAQAAVPEFKELAWLRSFRVRLPSFMPNFKGAVHADRLITPFIAGDNFNAVFNLRGIQPGMGKLSGTIEAEIGPGVIYQLEKMAGKEKALNVAFKPFLAMHRMEQSGAFKVGTVLKDVSFKQMAGAFDFTDGLMSVYNFYIYGPVLSAAMEGDIYWVSEKIKTKVFTLFNSKSGVGGLSESLTDANGNPALCFDTVGPMNKINVVMNSPKDVSKSIDSAVKRGLRADFQNLKNFVKGE